MEPETHEPDAVYPAGQAPLLNVWSEAGHQRLMAENRRAAAADRRRFLQTVAIAATVAMGAVLAVQAVASAEAARTFTGSVLAPGITSVFIVGAAVILYAEKYKSVHLAFEFEVRSIAAAWVRGTALTCAFWTLALASSFIPFGSNRLQLSGEDLLTAAAGLWLPLAALGVSAALAHPRRYEY